MKIEKRKYSDGLRAACIGALEKTEEAAGRVVIATERARDEGFHLLGDTFEELATAIRIALARVDVTEEGV